MPPPDLPDTGAASPRLMTHAGRAGLSFLRGTEPETASRSAPQGKRLLLDGTAMDGPRLIAAASGAATVRHGAGHAVAAPPVTVGAGAAAPTGAPAASAPGLPGIATAPPDNAACRRCSRSGEREERITRPRKCDEMSASTFSGCAGAGLRRP